MHSSIQLTCELFRASGCFVVNVILSIILVCCEFDVLKFLSDWVFSTLRFDQEEKRSSSGAAGSGSGLNPEPSSLRRDLMQMLGLTVPRTTSTSTQTVHRVRRTASTQTDSTHQDDMDSEPPAMLWALSLYPHPSRCFQLCGCTCIQSVYTWDYSPEEWSAWSPSFPIPFPSQTMPQIMKDLAILCRDAQIA